MTAIEYGSYYWCVVLKETAPGAPAETIHLHADGLAVDSTGALTFMSRGRRPAGTEPEASPRRTSPRRSRIRSKRPRIRRHGLLRNRPRFMETCLCRQASRRVSRIGGTLERQRRKCRGCYAHKCRYRTSSLKDSRCKPTYATVFTATTNPVRCLLLTACVISNRHHLYSAEHLIA